LNDPKTKENNGKTARHKRGERSRIGGQDSNKREHRRKRLGGKKVGEGDRKVIIGGRGPEKTAIQFGKEWTVGEEKFEIPRGGGILRVMGGTKN